MPELGHRVDESGRVGQILLFSRYSDHLFSRILLVLVRALRGVWLDLEHLLALVAVLLQLHVFLLRLIEHELDMLIVCVCLAIRQAIGLVLGDCLQIAHLVLETRITTFEGSLAIILPKFDDVQRISWLLSLRPERVLVIENRVLQKLVLAVERVRLGVFSGEPHKRHKNDDLLCFCFF